MPKPLYQQIYERFQLGPASHMLHIDNLDSVLRDGALYSKNKMSSRTYVSIANSGVQARRAAKLVPQSGRLLHDYVPLYFGNRTPMVADLQEQNESIIFFRFSLEVLTLSGVVFTDGNAASSNTQFFEFSSLDSLKALDVGAIQTVQYANDPVRRHRKQAEILIPDSLDISHIYDIVCFSNSARESILSNLVARDRKWTVSVNPGSWYFRTPTRA